MGILPSLSQLERTSETPLGEWQKLKVLKRLAVVGVLVKCAV